jgi:hypothetical protein
MKRAVRTHRRVFLLAGTLLVLAGIAWGAAARPHSSAPSTIAVVSPAPAQTVNPQPAPVLATARVASKHVTSQSQTPVQKSSLAAGEAGMRIFKDPETGEIGPPSAENAAIIARDAGPEVDVTKLPVVQLPNGGYELLIDGKNEDAMIMQIDAKGNRVVRCVQDQKAALKQTPQAPAREDR